MKNIIKEQSLKLTSKHNNRPFIADISYVPNQTVKSVVLFIHGFKGFKDWGHWHLVAEYFARQDFVFIKTNLSHNGTTPDQPTEFADLEAFSENNFSISLDDIGTVLDHLENLKTNEIDLSKIYLIGHSLGGGLALLKAAEDTRIKKTVTWAGVHDFKFWLEKNNIAEWKKNDVMHVVNGRTGQEMPLKFQVYEDLLNHFDRLDIPSNTKKITTPIFIIQGTNDPAVPIEAAKAIHDWAPSAQLAIIDGADHVFGGAHPYKWPTLPRDMQKVVELTLGFLKN